MLRRVKVDVEKDLPPKKETKLYIGMTAMQVGATSTSRQMLAVCCLS
jgi:SNF2 family DNA or RNA helicase